MTAWSIELYSRRGLARPTFAWSLVMIQLVVPVWSCAFWTPRSEEIAKSHREQTATLTREAIALSRVLQSANFNKPDKQLPGTQPAALFLRSDEVLI